MSLTTHQNFDKIWNNPNIGKQYHAAEMVTLVFARELVAQSRIVSVPIDTPLSVLDQACGTGVVALALHEALTERTETSWSLTCTDMSQNMLDVLQERVEIAGWKNTDVKISDIQKNGLLSAQYSHVFSSFGEEDNPGIPSIYSLLTRCLWSSRHGSA
jgi:ubiquinone/menaquinone biosynthesis C-methylase UbiE